MQSPSSSLSSPPSSSQPQVSHSRTKASQLCQSASLSWAKRNHVGPAKATSPSIRLRRWRPLIRLPSVGLHSVVSVVHLQSFLTLTQKAFCQILQSSRHHIIIFVGILSQPFLGFCSSLFFFSFPHIGQQEYITPYFAVQVFLIQDMCQVIFKVQMKLALHEVAFLFCCCCCPQAPNPASSFYLIFMVFHLDLLKQGASHFLLNDIISSMCLRSALCSHILKLVSFSFILSLT